MQARRVLSLALVVCGLALLLMAVAGALRLSALAADSPFGAIEVETKSAYSHIRVYKKGAQRTMIFVRDNGYEAIESLVDLDRPHELSIPYTQFMFASYFVQPKPEKALIIGLGGGSMIHFLRRHDPAVHIDSVEIDPAVVELAKKHFAVPSDEKSKLFTEDGLKYLEASEQKYDVIYMDAFLKPSADTDKTGAPLNMRTLSFYENVQKRLNPGGVVVFNLNVHADLNGDLATIKKGFKQTYVFRLAKGSGCVAVASPAAERLSAAALQKAAGEIDKRFGANFSFTKMVKHLER